MINKEERVSMRCQQIALLTNFVFAVVLCYFHATSTKAANPWADHVVSYIPGSGIPNDFVSPNTPLNNPTAALGEPTRFTSDLANFGGAVTPFNAPFRANEIVTIGEGGELVLSFDEPVVNDPQNPFGADLLIFGNAFLDFFTGNPVTEGGMVEVSSDGLNFVQVPGIEADGLFPTLGYLDLTDPFPTTVGTVLSDFTRPVDPKFDVANKTMHEILAGYARSGGGVPIDLSLTGLNQVTHIRVTNPIGSGQTPEIDALSDVAPVPEPATWELIGLSFLYLATRFNPRNQ